MPSNPPPLPTFTIVSPHCFAIGRVTTMGHEKMPSNTQNRLQKLRSQGHVDPSIRVEPLRTVEASRDGKSAMESVPIKACLPWNAYEVIYALHLGDNGPVVVAERRGISFDVVDIGCFEALSDDQIRMLKAIQHPNFVTVHEIYRAETKCYVAYEHMPRSLEEVAGNPYLSSDRLAAIVGQIVVALAYLEGKGLQHGHLASSRILLHPSGTVKLGNQEDCTPNTSTKDIRDVGLVMMELMEGDDVKDGTTIGLDHPERWTDSAIEFLSATTSASSVSELLEHPFLRSWHKAKLKGLASFVMAWTRPDYEYLGWQNKL
ncbi:hypothetical protein JDV02_001889 [Purpureocillium takamizusanense]|uniref:Protein kinase domain-containing protein n=1 Tax=Purpureocillium takamizusanense TaxID=2060973 RepID=A0A9Q8V7Z9_9HYPO|nr:uncharacterized protein JDV02_001889 [Purpureocillium takamizusanense]UNI15349.1 hypothetical protein JDV02_001889 [Purpureocillium takamizusanense]